MAKRAREEWKTYQNVFDNFTYRVLDKLISGGHVEGIIGPVSIGKESNVFSGKTKDGKVIIKIYRLETCDFNRMYEYIRYDPRIYGLKKQRRKVIFEWVKREYRNIMRARDLGVRVPKPLVHLYNVLIEEHIGVEHAAPKLKDCFPENPEIFFGKVMGYIKKLYDNGFVHADLSHFNILNNNEMPVFIDFSTMTVKEDPNFSDYLRRDVVNICNFATKRGYPLDFDEEMKKITG